MCLLAPALHAGPLKVATYHVELSRDGPGLLLRDILDGDPQVAAVARVVARAAPDVLALTGIDHDDGLVALAALRDVLAEAGIDYPHLFAQTPNSGLASFRDLDGDGRLGEPDDAQGWGRFAGAGGMAVLSRYPLRAVAEFDALLWAEVPGTLMTEAEQQRVGDVQRLSSTGHWIVEVAAPEGGFDLLLYCATPPVFDGPEDRNGRRNADESLLWLHYLDGRLPVPPRDGPFVLLGNANLDPEDGEGRRGAIRTLLADPRLQDPRRSSPGGAASGGEQRGPPALDTADWSEPAPGNLRVDYVLPSAGWKITEAGVLWPVDDGGFPVTEASRHRLVWVELMPP